MKIWNKFDSIENHYQLCKRFGEFIPRTWRDAKGKQPTHIELNGREYEIKYLGQFYKLLWVKYLDNNPALVEYASSFDEFNDIFKGKSINCQADVIRQYIKNGRESVMNDCKELIEILRNNK